MTFSLRLLYCGAAGRTVRCDTIVTTHITVYTESSRLIHVIMRMRNQNHSRYNYMYMYVYRVHVGGIYYVICIYQE